MFFNNAAINCNSFECGFLPTFISMLIILYFLCISISFMLGVLFMAIGFQLVLN